MRRHEDFDPGRDDEGRERVEPPPAPRGGIGAAWILGAIGLVLLAIFAIQNSDKVDVDFLFFDAQVRVVVVILVAAVLGFVVGWAVGRPNRTERRAIRRGMEG
ncbi:MAG TPA: lipopolysaccharide assembly protein LapA domain-containing protein [Actinomycetota bacterium]|nr:lipopolysaccharide assembly protein LapA domain-containing protein [Actinomycetota bacterium]